MDFIEETYSVETPTHEPAAMEEVAIHKTRPLETTTYKPVLIDYNHKIPHCGVELILTTLQGKSPPTSIETSQPKENTIIHLRGIEQESPQSIPIIEPQEIPLDLSTIATTIARSIKQGKEANHASILPHQVTDLPTESVTKQPKEIRHNGIPPTSPSKEVNTNGHFLWETCLRWNHEPQRPLQGHHPQTFL